jgi:putative ABC transport system ATP-binding protein
LSFSADAHPLTLVSGPSGAGKSTLLSLVAGLRRPTSGQVLFGGQAVSRLVAGHRDRFRQRVGFVAQQLYLFDELSTLENALLPSVPRPPDPSLLPRAAALFEALELQPERPVYTLSYGEKQRVALARALLCQPELLVLDEPSAHQDARQVLTIAALVRQAQGRGAVVLVAAHDPRIEEALGASQLLKLEHGHLLGPASALPDESARSSP